MDEIVGYLTGIPAWFLATIDEHDAEQPRVRPFSFACADAGKLWFVTSRDKDVWRELSANPKFELSGWKPGEFWIVLSGEADLADDANVSEAVRQAGYEHMVGIGEHHDSPNDGASAADAGSATSSAASTAAAAVKIFLNKRITCHSPFYGGRRRFMPVSTAAAARRLPLPYPF